MNIHDQIKALTDRVDKIEATQAAQAAQSTPLLSLIPRPSPTIQRAEAEQYFAFKERQTTPISRPIEK